MPLLFGRHTCGCARHREGITGFHSPTAATHYPPDLSIDPTHADIDLAVDVETSTASGTVTLTLIGRRDGPTTVVLDAVSFIDLQISSASPQTFQYDGEKITVTFDQPFEQGEQRTIAISYRVVEPITGLFFSKPSDTNPSAGTWAATDHETERARYWLPCIDHPNVRMTLAFHLRADATFTILANGEQAGETIHEDGTKTVDWLLNFPCPSYLTCFALGDFTVVQDDDFQGMPVAYYAESKYPEEDLSRSFGRTGEMLAWMTKKLGMAFPFPKYFQFALPQIGGAMENISLVSWDDVFVLDEELGQEWSWLVDQVNVHEMAHSYFGDAVVCRDFAHVWLKESWATYMEQCWLEDRYGDDEKQYDFFRNARAYVDESENQYSRPVVTRKFDSSWDMFDRHLYPGGACRLHTLRNELGDETFWAGVRNYLKTFAGKVVETEDFRKSLEEQSGRSLGQFFDQWFYTPGFPDLEATYAFDKEKGRATISVTQKQAEKGHTFKIPFVVEWTVDGTQHRKTFALTEAVQHFGFDAAAAPTAVRIDPDATVLMRLSFNPGDKLLRTQLSDAGDVIGRIYAARELAKTGTRENIDALKARYGEEKFWGVRCEIADAIAKIRTQYATDVYVSLVAGESDPMVTETLIRSGFGIRDEAFAKVLEKKLPELGVRSAGAALEALGRQRERAPIDLLTKWANTESRHDFTTIGAIAGLAQSRELQAVETLVSIMNGQGLRKRGFAAMALGELGRFSEKRQQEKIIELLSDFLKDDDVVAARRAATGLQVMKATSAIGELSAFKARLPHQEQVGIGRVLTGLRSPASDVLKSLESQLEKLQDEYKKQSERIAKLEGHHS